MAQLLAVPETQAKEITVLREAAENRLHDLQKIYRFHQETVDRHQADLVRLTRLYGTVALHEQQLAEMESLRSGHANRLVIIERSDALLHQQQAELEQLRAFPSPLHQEPPPPATEPNSNQHQRGQSA